MRTRPVDRRGFAVLGAVIAVGWTAFAVAFGFRPALVAWYAAAALWMAGGLDPGGVAWYRLAGAGHLVAALTVVVDGARAALGAAPASTAYGVAAVVCGLAFAAIGIDWLRGGVHFELDQFEPAE